jgi:hypothetical protein
LILFASESRPRRKAPDLTLFPQYFHKHQLARRCTFAERALHSMTVTAYGIVSQANIAEGV